jgi:eukaryotic-like serine/threonine-protein kinase
MSRWEDKWELVESLAGGGQGDVALVKPRGTEGPVRFLKVLRDNRQERRERMRREIACYATLHHPRIPQLFDSNADAFEDPAVMPYLVSEYVGGRHLEDYVGEQGYLRAAEAFDFALKLLDTVTYAHTQETVHRDIKPSNVVLRDGQQSEPVLVDFGMSFYEGEDRLTPGGQEIGNRFLRLPEFSANSSNKRDPRSDVTLCAGILFYMLTGLTPRNLRDEHGSAPHQTGAGRAALARHIDIDLLPLLDVFDRAFDPVIHARWDTAEALSTALRRIRIGVSDGQRDESEDEILARLKATMDRHDEQRLQLRREQLDQAFWRMREAVNAIATEIPGLTTTQGGYTIDPAAGRATGMLGILKVSDSRGYNPNYLIELQGTELVISLDGVPTIRCAATDVTANPDAVSASARTHFLRGLRSRIGE